MNFFIAMNPPTSTAQMKQVRIVKNKPIFYDPPAVKEARNALSAHLALHKPTKRPCSFPGCPRLTNGRFCEEHAKAEAKRYEQYDRDPETRRRYGRVWKRIRDAYVQQHPVCELCQRDGRLVTTEEVHHKVPLAEGGTHDRNNLISLCKACHAKIHAERGDRWHNS